MTTEEPDLPAVADPMVQAVVDRVMASGELPRQLEEVHRAWPRSRDQVWLLANALEMTLEIRGVPVRVRVPYDAWPEHPPVLSVVDPTVTHPNVTASGIIDHLDGQHPWNRTVTLADLLRELERRFIERPPRRRRRWFDWLARAARAVWPRRSG